MSAPPYVRKRRPQGDSKYVAAQLTAGAVERRAIDEGPRTPDGRINRRRWFALDTQAFDRLICKNQVPELRSAITYDNNPTVLLLGLLRERACIRAVVNVVADETGRSLRPLYNSGLMRRSESASGSMFRFAREPMGGVDHCCEQRVTTQQVK